MMNNGGGIGGDMDPEDPNNQNFNYQGNNEFGDGGDYQDNNEGEPPLPEDDNIGYLPADHVLSNKL
jgi:hypothetical protein